ncbi:MAG: O-antigen ligase family protein, partial [Acidobacteriota bacterium]|nr:O-antigen ligase family protein [Acidobacteriota bacterium]
MHSSLVTFFPFNFPLDQRMSTKKPENRDYSSLNSARNGGDGKDRDIAPLKSSGERKSNEPGGGQHPGDSPLANSRVNDPLKGSPADSSVSLEPRSVDSPELPSPKVLPDNSIIEISGPKAAEDNPSSTGEDESWAEELKKRKQATRAKKDFDILKNESWVIRNGHFLTYIGLYLFSILVFFRPYELVPGLGFLAATAFYVALATVFLYLPTQLATEGTLTSFSTEVKSVTVITVCALISIPIAKSPALAWETFNDPFIKAIVIFVVMVNVLRTRVRLMGIVWLSLSIGFVLSYMALAMYMRGEITVEGYRVAVDVGGMFGNPNEMALHLVMMMPIAICLGLAEKRQMLKIGYFVTAVLFVAATVVTYSRGGFLALLAVTGVLAWKLGKRQRAKILGITAVFAVLFILLAPGEYGQRIFSIFDSSLDSVGSANQRTELLERSIIVSIRNPWGIGIGNFQIVGIQNLGTHNAYTQVSAELGVVGLLAYLVFLISPFRKLGAIERTLLSKNETRW